MLRKHTVSVLIPAYNEEDAIESTVHEVQKTLKPVVEHFEIIVINDGSTDRTGELAEKAGARVIHHPACGGYGLSLKDGIAAAQYEWIAITDADGTYPIRSLPDLLSYLPDFDMVVGARQGKHYRGTFLKYPARKIFLWLCEFSTGGRIADINSGLRVFKKDIVTQYFNTLCHGFSFTTTITLAFLFNGHFVKYIPIDYFKRQGKSKVRYFRDTLRTAQIIVEAILYYNPLKLFLLLVVAALALALVFALIGFFAQSTVFTLLSGQSLLVGLLLGGMGFMADLLRRIKEK